MEWLGWLIPLKFLKKHHSRLSTMAVQFRVSKNKRTSTLLFLGVFVIARIQLPEYSLGRGCGNMKLEGEYLWRYWRSLRDHDHKISWSHLGLVYKSAVWGLCVFRWQIADGRIHQILSLFVEFPWHLNQCFFLLVYFLRVNTVCCPLSVNKDYTFKDT